MTNDTTVIPLRPNDQRGKLSDAQLQIADKVVGSQIRFRRISLGLSQQAVSEIMGLTFQQLQKYEHGTNRVSASRLYQLSRILHVPVSFFFEQVDAELGVSNKPVEIPGQELPSGVMNRKKTIDLVRSFYAIQNANERDAAFKLIATLAATSGGEG